MNIYIIILHYGKLDVTKKCIDSLSQQKKTFKKIMLINNDKDVKLSASQFKTMKGKIRVVNNKKNVGFAKGVNAGIRYALSQKAEYIFLLNNDTIIGESLLKQLVTVCEKELTIGIVAPAISFYKQKEMYYDLGGKVNFLFGRTSHTEVEAMKNKHLRVVRYVSGCCMLIKKEVFKKTGFFDEDFFLYYEDVDFCLRAKEKGYLSCVLPSVAIYHELSKAAGKVSPFSVYYQTKSGVLFGKKYCKIQMLNAGFLLAQSMLFFLKKKDAGIAAFKGLQDGLRMV